MVSDKLQELIDTARKAYDDYDFDGAYDTYLEAIALLKQESGPLQEKKIWIQIYKGIVDTLDKGGKWLNALEYAGILISEAKNKGNKRVEIETRLMACNILINHGNWPEGKKRYQVTLDLAQKGGSKRDLAECHYGLAYIDWKKGDTKSARFKTKKAIDLLKDYGVSLLQCKAIILQASVEDTSGNTKDAIALFQDAIEKLKTLGPNEELGRAYNNLGEAYKGIEDYKSAAKQYEECVKASKEVKSKRGILYGLCNTAECYAFNGRTDEAREIVKEVENILKDTHEKYIMVQVPYIRGIIAWAEKDYETACKEYEITIHGLKKIGNPPYDLGITYFRYGIVLKEKGDDKASRAFEKAKNYFIEADAKLYLQKMKDYV